MCGIFYTNSVSAHNYVLFDKIKHRGPDISIIISENNHMYGFHRLAIINPNSEYNQPYVKDGVVLLCNGEIYNMKELIEKYELKEEYQSDCEVILDVYLKTGSILETIQSIDGEFGIIIHDTNKNIVYAARDFMGIRPLYYSHDSNKTIHISSELKALPCNGQHIIPRFIYSFNVLQHVADLPTLMTFQEYWSFPTLSSKTMVSFNLINELYNLLNESVKSRLTSDQPVGCLLSGGIDSSLIVALASKHIPNIRCFTIGSESSPDVQSARLVAKFLNVPLTVVDFSFEEGISKLIPVIYHLETYDITTIRASVPQYILAKWISKNTDIKVILSGEGSDELFSGYVYSKLAPTPEALFDDGVRLLSELYQYDCLRTDRTLSAWGLEVRVPFLNKKLIEFVLGLNPEYRMCSQKPFEYISRNLEKNLLRTMIQYYKLLPDEISTRPKEAFSDAVSSKEKSWYRTIQDWIHDHNLEDKIYTHVPPNSKESKYYRNVFDLLYPKQEHILKKYWLPKWTKQTDPSATVLDCYVSTFDS